MQNTINTTNTEATVRPVNTAYQYESEDINAIMRARLHGLVNTHILAGTLMNDNAQGNRITDVLAAFLSTQSEMAHQSQTIIIPIERAEHWIGLRIQIENHAITAIYFHNSLRNPDTDHIFMQQMQRELLNARLIHNTLQISPAMHDLQQDDDNSCGAYLIENIYYSLINHWPQQDLGQSLSVSIRQRHLDLLETHQPDYYHSFVERQLQNRISVQRTISASSKIHCYDHSTFFVKAPSPSDIPCASHSPNIEVPTNSEFIDPILSATPPDFVSMFSLSQAMTLHGIFESEHCYSEPSTDNPYSIYDDYQA